MVRFATAKMKGCDIVAVTHIATGIEDVEEVPLSARLSGSEPPERTLSVS